MSNEDQLSLVRQHDNQLHLAAEIITLRAMLALHVAPLIGRTPESLSTEMANAAEELYRRMKVEELDQASEDAAKPD